MALVGEVVCALGGHVGEVFGGTDKDTFASWSFEYKPQRPNACQLGLLPRSQDKANNNNDIDMGNGKGKDKANGKGTGKDTGKSKPGPEPGDDLRLLNEVSDPEPNDTEDPLTLDMLFGSSDTED